MRHERGFKGIWIPAEIWLNKDLTIVERLFLVEIDSLDNEKGCFASNAHFAEMFDLSKGRCTQIIRALEAKSLITVELEREGKQITKRILRVVRKLNTPFNELNTPIENIKHPYLENDEGNNTTNNNTKSRKRGDKPPPPPKWTDDDLALAKQILELVRKLSPSAELGQSWANDVRLMREKEKHTHHEIASMFQFANKHPFWKANILSPGKLRKQWVQLEAELSQYKDKPMPGETPKEARDRIRAGRAPEIKPKYLNDLGF